MRGGRGLHDLPGHAESFEFAGLFWAFVVRVWPMAHPAPVMATVLAEPQFAPMRVDFAFVTRRMLTVVLDGLTSRADPRNAAGRVSAGGGPAVLTATS